MKRSFVYAVAAIAALLGNFLLAPAVHGQATWAELSKRMAASCAKFEQSVKDITITMELAVPSSGGALTSESLVYLKGDRFRAEISMEGLVEAGLPAAIASMKTIVVGDSAKAWIINPVMGKSEIPVSEGTKYSGQWRCGDYMPADAKVTGVEKVGGRDCFVLEVQDENSGFATLWIDQKSLNLMKAEGVPGEGETNITIFSDYRKVAGDLEFPYKTEVYSGADLISTITMKSIEINKGLADELFDADKIEAAGPDAGELLKKLKNLIKSEENE